MGRHINLLLHRYRTPRSLLSTKPSQQLDFMTQAKNIVNYLRIMHDKLAPGGVWINLGPLLWHWENNNSGEMSIELDLEEIKELAKVVGFKISVSAPLFSLIRGVHKLIILFPGLFFSMKRWLIRLILIMRKGCCTILITRLFGLLRRSRGIKASKEGSKRFNVCF